MSAHTPEEISKQFDEITSPEVMRQLRIFNAAPEMFELLKDVTRDCPMTTSAHDLLRNHNRSSDLIQKIEGEI